MNSERSTNINNSLPVFMTDSGAELAEITANSKAQRRERWQTAKKYAAKIGGAALIGATIATGSSYAYIQRDVNIGKAEVADSHPAVHEIYKNTDPDMRQVATYVATGMGTRDSTETAEKLTAHHEVGSVYAIEYSNEEIDIYELTDTIVAHAQANDIRYLSFDGYSAGGPIELAIAAEIHERFSDLHVVNITLNSSPIGEGSLTTESDEGGKLLGAILRYWPSLAYSKQARLAAEVLARKDRYYDEHSHSIDSDSLSRAIEDVKREKINDEKAASGSLIASQINFIYSYLAERNIARLSVPIGRKQPPMLNATYSSDPSTDRVVDNVTSARNVEYIIGKHFMALSIITIDNIGHANPGDRPTEYNQTITNDINPHILAALRVDYGIGGTPEYGDHVYLLPPQQGGLESKENIDVSPNTFPNN